MAKFMVTVTETYCKAIPIEASDAETAEALIRGLWDQGELDLAAKRDTFDGVAFEAQPQDEVPDGQDDEL